MAKSVFWLVSIGGALLAADLPVQTVILYKHGVGFFERSGNLAQGETARLEFKAGEMNDVLKSLTLLDASGAKISGLRYDSSNPVSERLAELPFQIPSDGIPSLSRFLNQMRGARLEIRLGQETTQGSIVSARTIPGTQQAQETEQLLLLLDSAEIRQVNLSVISGLKFTDPALQNQMREYLRIVADGRSKEKRNVYIDSADSGTRKLRASYMIPVPVWKSSYRLVFPETGEPTLEGWAIVDNTTGDDWTKIKLSLVSGRPISFITELYQPRYKTRPRAELAEEANVGPVVHEGAMLAAPAPAQMAMAPMAEKSARFRGMVGGAAPMAEPAADMATTSSIDVNTVGQERGELFEYSFGTPVTIRKNESAMLPFLQQKLGARKLLIYSENLGEHPMNAAELTNSTGKTLDGGPITIFDGGVYGGEALMETLKQADKRLISYAVDLGTRITTKYDSDRAIIRRVSAKRGLITSRVAATEIKTFTIKNVDAKAKTLIIEHPVREGYKLTKLKPAETTNSNYRFEVKLTPSGNETFSIQEEREYDNQVLVSNYTPEQLFQFIQNQPLTAKGKQQLEQIAGTKRQIADTERQRLAGQRDIDSVFKDQERIRENINRLNNVPGQQEQVQRYARTLSTQETQLTTLRDKDAELVKKKSALESELNQLIESLDF